jgi:hypothetical protein
MKLYQIFEELLNEATPVEVYEKYYKSIPETIFIKIVSTDPQSVVNLDDKNNIDVSVKKIGKFSKLLLSLYLKNNLKIEDLVKAKEYLTLIYKHNVSIDINKIKGLGDLYDIVKRYIASGDSRLSNIINTLTDKDYRLLFNGDDWVIYQPLTEIGSCYLGVNTEWCTTWGSNSLNPKHKDRTNYFNRYNKTGLLYIIINKKNENDKYQFHFEDKQFMNPSDVQINVTSFLDKNIEVKNFFFPSLVNKVKTNDVIESQISKMDVLSNDDLSALLTIFYGDDINNNKLLYDLLNENENELEEEIIDYDFKGIRFSKDYIIFELLNPGYILDTLRVNIGEYEYRIQNSHDEIYDRIRNDITEADGHERLKLFFKKYYDENEVNIKTDLGVFDYRTFEEYFFKEFIEDSDIRDKYCQKYADLNYPAYEDELNNELTDIKKFIDIEYYSGNLYEIQINKIYFIQYLINKKINKIENNLEDLIESFISFKGISTEFNYDSLYDINYQEVEWSNFESDVNEYFEELIDKIEIPTECINLKKKFNDIFLRLFKNNVVFENEHVYVKILGGADCENGSVKINYKNKDTGEDFTGDVKVDSLASYVTNYKLFECFIRFNKIIK